MKTLALTALGALLLAGPAHADAPAPATVPARAEGAAKTSEPKPSEGKKGPGAGTPKPVQKGAEPSKKEAPCEPVKPCPIE